MSDKETKKPILKTAPDKGKDTLVALAISRKEWRTAVLFLLSMSFAGLHFYPALLFVLGFMLHTWRTDRYDFVIMATLFVGGFGFIDDTITFVKAQDLMLVAASVLMLTFIKPPLIRQSLIVLGLYAAALIFIATFSRESMAVQFLTLRGYFTFAYFIIPIVAFSRHKFELREFCRRLMPYVLTICIFYILDAIIFCGNLLIPRTFIWGGLQSTFYDLYIAPLSFNIFRKYPSGILLVFLAIYPVVKYYRLRPWQWVVIFVALMTTQTATVIFAVVLTYILVKGGLKKLFKYTLILVVGVVSIYFIDGLLPTHKNDSNESAMRIKSTVDQFLELSEYVDDEDLAKFGSGRIAQVLPKYEVLSREGRQLTGLGFLHSEKTKIKDYVITNEYYSDIANNEEVATGIEIVFMQIFISAGYLGLIAHVLFFLILYLLIRRLRGSGYFVSVLCACFISGMGGFAQSYTIYGLSLLAMAYSAVILDNRESLKGFHFSVVPKVVKKKLKPEDDQKPEEDKPEGEDKPKEEKPEVDKPKEDKPKKEEKPEVVKPKKEEEKKEKPDSEENRPGNDVLDLEKQATNQ